MVTGVSAGSRPLVSTQQTCGEYAAEAAAMPGAGWPNRDWRDGRWVNPTAPRQAARPSPHAAHRQAASAQRDRPNYIRVISVYDQTATHVSATFPGRGDRARDGSRSLCAGEDLRTATSTVLRFWRKPNDVRPVPDSADWWAVPGDQELAGIGRVLQQQPFAVADAVPDCVGWHRACRPALRRLRADSW